METFGPHRALALLACSTLAWSGATAQAQSASSSRNANKRMEALQQQVQEQGRQIDALKQQSEQLEARYRELQERLSTQEARGAPRPDATQTAGKKPAAEGEGADSGSRPVQVGVAPGDESPQPPQYAQLFDEPGVLT